MAREFKAHARRRFSRSLLPFFILFLCTTSAAAIENDSIVARIAEREIRFGTLLPEERLRARRKKQLSEQAYAQWLLAYASSSLRAELLQHYRLQLQQERALEPTAEQIADFVEALQKAEAIELKELEAKRAALDAQLQSSTEREMPKQLLEEQLAEVKGLLRSLENSQVFAAAYPDLRAKLDLEVAERFLLRWLVDRELFLEYGGRVAFRYGGPEPIDAYRKYLTKRNKEGDFSILSKVLEQEFWRFFRREGRILLIPREDADAIYSTPTWSLQAQR